MKKHQSHSLEETADIARAWLQLLSKNADTQKATVVGLSGHLGAGKTAFVKLVAKEFGIIEEVTSPTFVIMKMYSLSNQPWKKLIHIDAYRLEKNEELKALNFISLVNDPDNLIIVEWPENVELFREFPESKKISFEIEGDVRTIAIE